MKLYNIALALGLAGLGVVVHSMAAQAIDFTFDFVGKEGTTTGFGPERIIGGEVTGIITGLDANTTSGIPSSIIINTNPLGFTPGIVLNHYVSGTFSVSNGVITGASNVNFGNQAFLPFVPSFNIFFNSNSNGNVGVNEFRFDGEAIRPAITFNNDGFDGVIYTPVTPVVPTTAVPEPNEQGLRALVLPLFLGLGIMKKRKALKST